MEGVAVIGSPRRCFRVFCTLLALCAGCMLTRTARAQDAALPELTQPVNDFAHIIDEGSRSTLDRLSRQLEAATGDVVVVATVPSIESYGDIREYANKLFENHGRGVGDKGKDNGLLILVAVKERKVWIEVGYALEAWITDGFAGETSREFMVPEFRSGGYGSGLVAGAERIVGRIAQGRNVTLSGVPPPRAASRPASGGGFPLWAILLFFIVVLIVSRIGGGPGASVNRWGRGGWSGWSSGVGPFGGGWGGGGSGGGGGFGGGFGGFGGGSSGGGGGGASW